MEFSKIFIPFYVDQEAILDDPIKRTSQIIIYNALNSIASSLAVLRQGYRLQPGILIRSVIESLAVVASFIQDKNNYKLYSEGKLDSTKAVSIGKKVLPLLGQMYGLFSDNFAHIGDPHRALNPLFEFKEKDEIVMLNLSFIRHAVHFTYILVELLCFDSVPNHRYWKKLKKGFAYCPSQSERGWLKEFLGEILSKKT